MRAWGVPLVRRAGRDLTILTYSRMLHESLAAAEALAARGMEAEVIDLRCLNPLDEAAIFDSVRRTGRAMVVTEAAVTGSVASEIAARVRRGLLRLAGGTGAAAGRRGYPDPGRRPRWNAARSPLRR